MFTSFASNPEPYMYFPLVVYIIGYIFLPKLESRMWDIVSYIVTILLTGIIFYEVLYDNSLFWIRYSLTNVLGVYAMNTKVPGISKKKSS
jgi:hypothetical protein